MTDPTLLFVNGAAPETAPPEPPPRGDHGDEPPELRALWAAVDRADATFAATLIPGSARHAAFP